MHYVSELCYLDRASHMVGTLVDLLEPCSRVQVLMLPFILECLDVRRDLPTQGEAQLV